ncbi:MAG: HAMP domain-containing protein, partial [Actinobacteria bacterium]|nr:HAMP domain-containing protein [Actinomycetota bacterium]
MATNPADAGDGSSYSEVNAANAEFLETLAETTGGGDLLLISASTGDVVYSANKRIDIGTSLLDGPYSETALSSAIADRLPQVQAGDSVLTTFEIYIPGGGNPVLFATSAVRSGTEVVGVLAVQVPVESLNAITTAGESWGDVGLGSGESYVVASDLLLQSESRLWIEDPNRYLDKTDDPELRSLLEIFGSPVGLQTVDTEAVREALEGRPFQGSTRNYLGEKTFTSSTPISVPGVRWVVVTDVPLGDALQPLNDYLFKMAIVLLLVLPSSALVGFWLAKRLTRPIAPAVEAALAVSNGERQPQLPALGNDEFGDLGRRLIKMAKELERQETALADEYENTRQLMLAVLPTHLVTADGELSDTAATSDTATVVAVSVDLDRESLDADDNEIVEAFASVARFAEDLAEQHSLDRIRVAADRFLFLAGSRQDSDGSDDALKFASALTRSVTDFGVTNDMAFVTHVGLSTGKVATGVLERGSLTFGAWGEPVRRALAIGALSQDEEILVDASTAGAAADSWIMESA